MPFQLSRGDRKILLIAAAVFLVLILSALLLLSPEANQSATPTTYSSNSSGAKAAFLLLQNSGYRIERWEKSPETLQTGRHTTLILAEPSQFASKEERAALLRFIEQGGRLIAIGPSAAWMLPENAAREEPLEGTIWEQFPALAPSAETLAAPQITLAPKAFWMDSGAALPLYGKDNRPVAVRYSYGKGVVFWWASATPLTNAGLKEPGNMEFFLSCLGSKNNTRIVWDEYFHGYGGSGKTNLEMQMLVAMLIQLGIAGLAVLITFSRRSGLLRIPILESRLSPLEFVETLGGLYQHARASSVAVDIHYQRFLYLLTKRLGMTRNHSIEAIESAIQTRWSFHDADFAGILRQCSSARYHPDMAPRHALKLIRSLFSYAIQLKLYAEENTRWKPFRNY